jgi:MYXO-CTERM domain-containing protein
MNAFPWLTLTIVPLVLLSLAVPAAAVFELDVEAAPIEEPVPLGETRTSEVTVTLTAADAMVCPGGDELTVALRVENVRAEEGLNAAIATDTLTFSFGAGAYGVNDTVAESSWEDTATLTVELGSNISRATPSHDFNVVAEYDGTPPGQCQGSSSFQAVSDTAAVRVEIAFPEEDGGTDGDGDGMPGNGDDNETDGGEEEEDSPAPAFGALLIVTLALLVVRRRRH